MGNKITARQKIYRSVSPLRRHRQNARRMARTTTKTKLPRTCGGEMKRVTTARKPPVVVPVVVVAVDVHVALVVPPVESGRIVQRASHATTHQLLSGLYRIRDSNRLAPRTKYLLFFKLAYTTLFLIAIKKTLGVRPLDSAAGNPRRPRTRLLPFGILARKKASRKTRGRVLREQGLELSV